jgi:polygalacturonase
MKTSTAILALCCSIPAAAADRDPGRVDWDLVPWIVEQIEAPRIPRRDVRVSDHGGKPDPATDARPAILRAIDAASAAGGGRVILGPGTWRSDGPVVLKSRIELHLEEGATLLFSPEPRHYLPPVRTRWEGTEVLTYSPLIYAADVEDVAVTGPGVIDGNEKSGFHPFARRAEADFRRLRRMGFDGVPLDRRVFGEGTYLRPPLVQVFGGRRVRLEGYGARNAPFWVNHLVYVEHAVVRGLKVDSHFPNNDGIDVESSRFVLVEDCTFRTGDDSVVVKSGRDLDGRTIGRPSEYVVVRRNDMGGEDGIGLGSEMSGGIRYVFFDDNVLRSGVSAIRFKSNLDRGGTVAHVGVRNMEIGSFERLLWFQLDYPSELGGNFPSTWSDIVFEDLRAGDVGTLVEARAPAGAPLVGLRLRRVSARSAKKDLVLENVEKVELVDVTVGGRPVVASAPVTTP